MATEIYDIQELSNLLGRSPATIKKDMVRNHLAVPPRIPGTRLLRWRRTDVDAWMASRNHSLDAWLGNCVEPRDAVRTSSQQRKATAK